MRPKRPENGGVLGVDFMGFGQRDLGLIPLANFLLGQSEQYQGLNILRLGLENARPTLADWV